MTRYLKVALGAPNTKVAYVELRDEGIFDRSLVNEEVFRDENRNGYQGEGEELVKVKLVTSIWSSQYG